MNNKIFKLEVKGLSDVSNVTWIKLPSLEGLRVDDDVLMIDPDSDHVKGGKVLNINRNTNKIKVVPLFRIDD